MGLPERLEETTVAGGYSTHIYLICGSCSLWDGCLFRGDASQSYHDPAVNRGDSVCARISMVIHPDVCHSLSNRSLVIANTCLSQRVVPN